MWLPTPSGKDMEIDVHNGYKYFIPKSITFICSFWGILSRVKSRPVNETIIDNALALLFTV